MTVCKEKPFSIPTSEERRICWSFSARNIGHGGDQFPLWNLRYCCGFNQLDVAYDNQPFRPFRRAIPWNSGGIVDFWIFTSWTIESLISSDYLVVKKSITNSHPPDLLSLSHSYHGPTRCSWVALCDATEMGRRLILLGPFQWESGEVIKSHRCGLAAVCDPLH